jgi:small subunit ribosomal protein S10
LEVVGPVYLPTRLRRYCVLRSPHVNKDSRDHYEIRVHRRFIEVSWGIQGDSSGPRAIERLAQVSLPPGLDVALKVID